MYMYLYYLLVFLDLFFFKWLFLPGSPVVTERDPSLLPTFTLFRYQLTIVTSELSFTLSLFDRARRSRRDADKDRSGIIYNRRQPIRKEMSRDSPQTVTCLV